MPVGYVDPPPKFRIFQDHGQWCVQAPTGIGRTVGLITRDSFEAAVRAMDEAIALHRWERQHDPQDRSFP